MSLLPRLRRRCRGRACAVPTGRFALAVPPPRPRGTSRAARPVLHTIELRAHRSDSSAEADHRRAQTRRQAKGGHQGGGVQAPDAASDPRRWTRLLCRRPRSRDPHRCGLESFRDQGTELRDFDAGGSHPFVLETCFDKAGRKPLQQLVTLTANDPRQGLREAPVVHGVAEIVRPRRRGQVERQLGVDAKRLGSRLLLGERPVRSLDREPDEADRVHS